MNGIRVDLTNTPGVYYVVAYFFSSCLYIRMNPRRYKGLKLWGIQGAFLLVLGFFMIVTDNINRVFYFPCVAAEIFLLWLSIYVCCRMDWKKALYFCTELFFWENLQPHWNGSFSTSD